MMIIGVMLMTGTEIALNSIHSMVEASAEEANMADYSLNLRVLPRQVINQTCEGLGGIQKYEERLAFRSTAYTVNGWPKSTEMLLLDIDKKATLDEVTLMDGRYFEDNEDAIVVEHDYGENVLGKDVLVETPHGNVTLKVVGTCSAA
jgi:hypothetical protein